MRSATPGYFFKRWSGLAKHSNTSILFIPANKRGLALPNMVHEQKKVVVNFKLPGSVPHRLSQYNIMFEECFFQHNGMIRRDRDSLGCGVFYNSENGLTILHNVIIMENKCIAIAAAQSTIEMYGTIIIQNNTGFNGGGLLQPLLWLEHI